MRVSKGKEKPQNLNFQNQSSKQADEIRYISVLFIKKLNSKPNVNKSKQKLYPIITNFDGNRTFCTLVQMPDYATLGSIALRGYFVLLMGQRRIF